jgi:hypothetical protein
VRSRITRDTIRATGAATKLRRAPILVSASALPAGNAAVAKKSDTVKPIDAAIPTIITSGKRSPGAGLAPMSRAAFEENNAERLTGQEAGENVVGTRSNLLERDSGIRESE